MKGIRKSSLAVFFLLVAAVDAFAGPSQPAQGRRWFVSRHTPPQATYSVRSPLCIIAPSSRIGSQQDSNAHPSSSTSEQSLWKTIDQAGNSLKPKARKASEKIKLAESKLQKLKYVLISSLLYSLLIIYRAYRGCFVLLPAVFQQVYKKLEQAVDSPFEAGTKVNGEREASPVADPKASRLGTRVTVSLLATLLTLSFLASGATRVFLRFVRTVVSTSSLTSSFAAAAEEQELNHQKYLQYGNRKKSSSSSDLAP